MHIYTLNQVKEVDDYEDPEQKKWASRPINVHIADIGELIQMKFSDPTSEWDTLEEEDDGCVKSFAQTPFCKVHHCFAGF